LAAPISAEEQLRPLLALIPGQMKVVTFGALDLARVRKLLSKPF